MHRYAIIFSLLVVAPAFSQNNSGEIRLHVNDSSGRGIQVMVHLVSEASRYKADLETDKQGTLNVGPLAYGIYRLDIANPDSPLLRRP